MNNPYITSHVFIFWLGGQCHNLGVTMEIRDWPCRYCWIATSRIPHHELGWLKFMGCVSNNI